MRVNCLPCDGDGIVAGQGLCEACEGMGWVERGETRIVEDGTPWDESAPTSRLIVEIDPPSDLAGCLRLTVAQLDRSLVALRHVKRSGEGATLAGLRGGPLALTKALKAAKSVALNAIRELEKTS